MITRVGYEVQDIVPKLNDDKSNLKDFYCADVHGGRSFLLNDAGYPMNDIDMVLRQQDESIRQSLISQLEEVPTTGVPSDTPPEEVLLSLRSRYQQTPSEMVQFYEKQLQIHDLNQSQVKENENIQFDKNDASDVVDNV